MDYTVSIPDAIAAQILKAALAEGLTTAEDLIAKELIALLERCDTLPSPAIAAAKAAIAAAQANLRNMRKPAVKKV